jgi:hypothetical protein
MARCRRAPHLAQCPGYPQFEFDSLQSTGLEGVNRMPVEDSPRILGGRSRQYTPQYQGISDILTKVGDLPGFSGIGDTLLIYAFVIGITCWLCGSKSSPLTSKKRRRQAFGVI